MLEMCAIVCLELSTVSLSIFRSPFSWLSIGEILGLRRMFGWFVGAPVAAAGALSVSSCRCCWRQETLYCLRTRSTGGSEFVWKFWGRAKKAPSLVRRHLPHWNQTQAITKCVGFISKMLLAYSDRSSQVYGVFFSKICSTFRFFGYLMITPPWIWMAFI